MNDWSHLAHVDPPPPLVEGERSLTFYLGPNHYPAGIYLPGGYDLEQRPGDEEGWTVLRARDSVSSQVLTLWAVAGEGVEGDQVKVLDP